MNTLNDYVMEYIDYCKYRKRLDVKTLKAYQIDLKQYENHLADKPGYFSKDVIDAFITCLHKQYKSKTVKRMFIVKYNCSKLQNQNVGECNCIL